MNDKNPFQLTIAQFAKLHNVNKRTLHYYDKIGLFSPKYKGENKYRYYHALQSIDFEYIRMFKELNISIEEIKNYVKNPNAKDFIEIADKKSIEIEEKIKQLKRSQDLLQTKKEQLLLSELQEENNIDIIQCEQQKLLTAPFSFTEEQLPTLFSYIKERWGIEQCRAGVGSYISLEKVKNKKFEKYDGLFTPYLKNDKPKATFIRPKRKIFVWLCERFLGAFTRNV